MDGRAIPAILVVGIIIMAGVAIVGVDNIFPASVQGTEEESDTDPSIIVLPVNGSAVSEASYIIYKDGAYTIAMDCMGQEAIRSTNASAVIQQAIDSTAARGGIVFVKSGTYTLTAQIDLRSNIKITGESRNSTILIAADGLNDHMLYGEDVEHVTVSSLTIDGNKAGNDPDYNLGTGITVANAVSHDDYNLFEDLHLTQFDDYGIILFTESDNDIVRNVEVDNCDEHGIAVDWCNDVIITECYAHDNLRSGVMLVGNKGTTVSNNKIFNNNQSGINNAGGYRVVLDGNTIYGSGTHGINLDISSGVGHNVKVSNNYIYNSTLSGIRSNYPDYLEITNNYVMSSGAYGIDLDQSDFSIVEGNYLTFNKLAGVFVHNNSTRGQVSNNVVYYNFGDGISLSSSNNVQISGNSVMNNIGHGIFANGGSGLVIDGNTFVDNDYNISHSYDNLRLQGVGYNALVENNNFILNGGRGNYSIWNSMGSTVIKNNGIGTGSAGKIYASDWNSVIVSGNTGFVTEAKGKVTIASGQTSVTVNFTTAFDRAPTGATLGARSVEVADAYVSSLSTTQIVITVGSATSGDREVDYYVFC